MHLSSQSIHGGLRFLEWDLRASNVLEKACLRVKLNVIWDSYEKHGFWVVFERWWAIFKMRLSGKWAKICRCSDSLDHVGRHRNSMSGRFSRLWKCRGPNWVIIDEMEEKGKFDNIFFCPLAPTCSIFTSFLWLLSGRGFSKLSYC